MNKKVINIYPKKIFPILLMFLVLSAGLSWYRKNEDYLRSFKSYYLISAIKANQYNLEYKLKNTLKFLKNEANAEKDKGEYAQSIPVLVYHGVISSYPDGSNVTIDNFIAQMSALKNAGYQTIGISDYYDFIYNGKKLPKKSFVLSFDDGRKDAYYPVDPILKAFNYRAVMFVITDESLHKKSKFYLSQQELLKMKNSGRWDLQVHTKSGHKFYPIDSINKGHFYTNKIWLENEGRIENNEEFRNRIKEDIVNARKDFEIILGIDPIAFAFPYGDIGLDDNNYPESKDILLDIVKENFKISFYQFWAGRGYSSNYIATKSFLNNRISIDPAWTDKDLINILEPTQAKTLPYKDNFSKNNGWLVSWGNLYFRGQKLVVNTLPTTNNAELYLDGSFLWRNYRLNANVHPLKGTIVKVLGNRRDKRIYLDCAFSEGKVSIEEVNGEKIKVLSEKLINKKIIEDKDINIGIITDGDDFSCTIDNEVILTVRNLSPELVAGGIGFEVWGSGFNNWLEINSLEVKPIKK